MIGVAMDESVTLDPFSAKTVLSTIQLSEDWSDDCTVKLFFLDNHSVPLSESVVCVF